MGVLISWLMFARNFVLAALARSAFSFAVTSCPSLSFFSVMSRVIATISEIMFGLSSRRTGPAVCSIQRCSPQGELHRNCH